MYRTVDAIIEPAGTVRLLEALQVDHPCRAFVTLLENPCAHVAPSADTASDVLKFLAQTRLTEAARLTAREIEAQIDAERQAWD
ncbi:MAG: hypothetical protein Q8O25_09805 [Sulfurisoma sp.]|nr:hypothetical protein [Sulfurisoma sp.]